MSTRPAQVSSGAAHPGKVGGSAGSQVDPPSRDPWLHGEPEPDRLGRL